MSIIQFLINDGYTDKQKVEVVSEAAAIVGELNKNISNKTEGFSSTESEDNNENDNQGGIERR